MRELNPSPGADACFYNTKSIEVPAGTDFEVKCLEDLVKYL